MSGFIPKEKLTAYERWELAAFDEADAAPAAPEPATGDHDDDVEIPASIPLPTAEEIERIHCEAHASGYAAGHAEGLAAALAEAEQIAALGENLRLHLQALDQTVAEELLAVAVEVASRVLQQNLRVKPELLLPVVREAVAALPLHHSHPSLFLHPDDAALVRTQLGEQLEHNGWRILEDSSLTRGGCRVEAGASEVDATLQTRWRRVLDTIGTTSDWLDDRP